MAELSPPRVPRAAVALALALVLAGTGPGCGDDDGGGDGAGSGTHEPAVPAGHDAAAGNADVDADAAAEAGPSVWVGTVDDSDVALGAIVDAGRARLFFCGGPSSVERSTRWLVAALDDDGRFALALDAADGGMPSVELDGELSAQRLSGQIALGDAPAAAFRAEPARTGTLAGLYEARADCGTVGLIVGQRAPDDEPHGQGACVGPGHVPQQVNPILPLALDDDGAITVELTGKDGPERVGVHAAMPAP